MMIGPQLTKNNALEIRITTNDEVFFFITSYFRLQRNYGNNNLEMTFVIL